MALLLIRTELSSLLSLIPPSSLLVPLLPRQWFLLQDNSRRRSLLYLALPSFSSSVVHRNIIKKSTVTGPLGSFHSLDYIFNRQFKHFRPSFILISLEIQSKFSLKYSPVDFSNRGNETVWGSLLIWSKFGSQVTISKEVWLIEENFFRCASISWFEVVSQWVSHWCFYS